LIRRNKFRILSAKLISCVSVPQTYTLQTKDSGAWDLGQRSIVVPYPLHASCPSISTDPSIGLHTSYPFNVNDPITTSVPQNMQYPCQQRPNAADAGHSIQQDFDSRMPQPQQPLLGLDMVSYCMLTALSPKYQ